MINKEEIELFIKNDWQEIFEEEFSKTYFKKLLFRINIDYSTKIIFPEKKQIFRAFENTCIKKVKVVIIGQDPYHGLNQANGLAFSVNSNQKTPPSLKNIFKEISNDIGPTNLKHGDLNSWSNQGVLLLNTSLTVVKNKPNSHANIGWETFTNNIILKLSKKKSNLVFLLWGNHAINKAKLITDNDHLILKSTHPSPLSAYRGFFGCKHFSKTNAHLKKHNIKPINWEIT